MEEETAEQTIERMARELEHVSEQSRVSHRMAVYWRAQYDKAERQRGRMEKSLNHWREKLLKQPKGQQITEHALALWDAEANTPETPLEPQY